jgi:hypothetical protein
MPRFAALLPGLTGVRPGLGSETRSGADPYTLIGVRLSMRFATRRPFRALQVRCQRRAQAPADGKTRLTC